MNHIFIILLKEENKNLMLKHYILLYEPKQPYILQLLQIKIDLHYK